MFAETLITPQQVADAMKAKQAAKKPRKKSRGATQRRRTGGKSRGR